MTMHRDKDWLNLFEKSSSKNGFNVMIIVYPMSTAIDIMHRHDIPPCVAVSDNMHTAYAIRAHHVKYFNNSVDTAPQNIRTVVRYMIANKISTCLVVKRIHQVDIKIRDTSTIVAPILYVA